MQCRPPYGCSNESHGFQVDGKVTLPSVVCSPGGGKGRRMDAVCVFLAKGRRPHGGHLLLTPGKNGHARDHTSAMNAHDVSHSGQVNALHRTLLKIRPEPLAAALKALLGISRREVETPYGRFFIDPVSNFGARVTSAEGYEPRETAEILALTRDAQTFVDIGANEGYFSIIAAKNMPKNGRVLAIEPQQRLLPVLQRNMSLNGVSFDIANCAIADHDKLAEMYFSTSINTGTTGFVRATRYPRRKHSVRVARLERVLSDAGMPEVDCMKMDIEGLEYEAVFGSPGLFEARSIKRLLIELHPRQMMQRGHDPTKLNEFLAACGYRNEGMVWRVA